jgi:hypothetical protein
MKCIRVKMDEVMGKRTVMGQVRGYIMRLALLVLHSNGHPQNWKDRLGIERRVQGSCGFGDGDVSLRTRDVGARRRSCVSVDDTWQLGAVAWALYARTLPCVCQAPSKGLLGTGIRTGRERVDI